MKNGMNETLAFLFPEKSFLQDIYEKHSDISEVYYRSIMQTLLNILFLLNVLESNLLSICTRIFESFEILQL